MKVTYEATFRIDLGQAIPAIGELLDSVNATVASLGCDERLKCYTSMFSTLVTVDRELTEGEIYKMKTILEAEAIKTFPKYDVRLESFRRQPGNVSQSVVQ